MAVSDTHNGWQWDRANSRLNFRYRGSLTGYISASKLLGVALESSTSVLAGTTVTAGSNLVAATGNTVLGTPGTFASTQPVAAVVMGGSSSGGTAPAGAITTSGAVFASDTVVRKIIADGTASNVET